MSDCLPGDEINGPGGDIRTSHTPVLLDEILELMKPAPGKRFIDATGGPGNMSRALLEKSSPDGRVLTLDCDPRASSEQKRVLGEFGDRSVRRLANFAGILDVASEEGFIPCDGIIYDLGVSSAMLDSGEYGMSIRHDAPLDMRFDPSLETSARDLVNTLGEAELVNLLREMDESRFARPIARAIIRERAVEPIESTIRLAEIVSKAVPRRFHPRNIHVATRTFLALRAEVNREKESLERSLRDCPDILAAGGVLAVICYSSFEDRIVKETVRESRDRWERMTRKPVRPDPEEIQRNPRSRSARLRSFRKVA